MPRVFKNSEKAQFNDWFSKAPFKMMQRRAATLRSPYQYYQLGATHRKSGNPVHTFETEELLMRTMAKDERIKFCDASGCVGSTTH